MLARLLLVYAWSLEIPCCGMLTPRFPPIVTEHVLITSQDLQRLGLQAAGYPACLPDFES